MIFGCWSKMGSEVVKLEVVVSAFVLSGNGQTSSDEVKFSSPSQNCLLEYLLLKVDLSWAMVWLEEEEEEGKVVYLEGGKSIFHQNGFGVGQMIDEELGYLALMSSTME